MRNWAGNVTYSTERVLRPGSVEEVQELIVAGGRFRALGTRHSFNRIGDTDGALVSTERLDRVLDITPTTATVEAGIRYGDLSRSLDAHGVALANLASLPHISVGGAIATGTHGSGVRNRSLAAAVSALDLVAGDGSVHRLRRDDDEFAGAVVGLGALGLVARVSLDVVPAFELRQFVFEGLPWPTVDAHLDELLAAGYSVSLFTTWSDRGADAWVKTRGELDAFFGATPAPAPRNPVAGAPPDNATEQLGVPGPSYERLPHFRLGFTPSSGVELQSEYSVSREHGADAVRALRALGPLLTPLLFVSEIRAVAADDLWLSPFHERDSVAFHFTWRPLTDEVLAAIAAIEAVLEPFVARPHWGKLFVETSERLYPALPEFRRLRDRLDPDRVFANDFLARTIGV